MSLYRIKKILVHNSNTPFSPDCTTHMDLDNCFSCYDDLSGVNREEYDTRHILEDFALSELEALGIDVQYLGFAIDLALRKVVLNFILFESDFSLFKHSISLFYLILSSR